MSFTSLQFLLFFLALVICYFAVPAKYRWIALLAGSIYFYVQAGAIFLPFLAGTALITWGAALLISGKNEKLVRDLAEAGDAEEKKRLKTETKNQCRRILLAALILVLGYLVWTKFAKKAAALLTALISGAGTAPALSVIVPLGISYYTFSTVGYLLDVYWKRYAPERNFFKYLLYVIFFPHILQGPIPRYDRLGPQLTAPNRFDYTRVCFGAQLMVWGFFQKLVIADRVGVLVSAVFGDFRHQPGSLLLAATLGYALQIYTDFSGCVNISRGMSQIFGITLDENFRQPYFAQSVEEFWQRWHITLGTWFRDYLCMPVSVSGPVKKWSKAARKKYGAEAGRNVTTISALVVVWLCTGIWHGTGFNYIAWGIWQGGIIAFSTLMKKPYEKMRAFFHVKDGAAGWTLFRIARTFLLTGIIPRIFVRSPGFKASLVVFKRILTAFGKSALTDGSLLALGLTGFDYVLIACSVVILFVVSLLKEKGVSIREAVAAKPLPLRWAFYLTALYLVVIFGKYGPGYSAASFVYMDF